MGGHSEGHGAPSAGHGHGPKFSIPDWRQYKVDGIKDLEWTRNSLAAKGLHDPWLRSDQVRVLLIYCTEAYFEKQKK